MDSNIVRLLGAALIALAVVLMCLLYARQHNRPKCWYCGTTDRLMEGRDPQTGDRIWICSDWRNCGELPKEDRYYR